MFLNIRVVMIGKWIILYINSSSLFPYFLLVKASFFCYEEIVIKEDTNFIFCTINKQLYNTSIL